MAGNLANDTDLVQEIKTLLWGPSVKYDVFKQWSQGFFFSNDEPTALVQAEGGPCAVIAPVQAFILKELLLESDISNWKEVGTEQCNFLLVKAMTEIVARAADSLQPRYCIVRTMGPQGYGTTSMNCENISNKVPDLKSPEENKKNDQHYQETTNSMENRLELEPDIFHSQLRIFTIDNMDELKKYFTDQIDMMKNQFGILLFLYTVVCTKGLAGMQSEMSDPMEPLIDSTYGYGSQSLINLMLTGRAVSHVWDHDQDVGGLKLQGIDKQNSVGFLAFLEHLRYCEVGTFLKAPSHPIWVLGSDTHLTVLFSSERRLVSPETPADQARRVFKKFDPEGNNFISSNLLQDVLAELDLVADTEYVEIMRKKLDSESLGIILLAAFMDEFFPEDPRTCPDTFVLFHYNGLPRSNLENKVTYRRGQAVLLECTVKCILDSNPMLTVLQTKWPSIEVQWDKEQTPSVN
ncbi:ubiquitin carboxyl-terminal hydrolase MINDY-3 homolog isoform X1 [Neodiprion virginianus]|uniref:ubiquitin carboxyl-terminal hydrolase MINDY-3 homolog isoform X1 n=2 Tax=Neodiprion virginianus TaxID=2961670 RepID=UPI001EE75BBD|nr:ubiquitin carboxyl-terminal hydrolase MINDY-3 homolog isoform X1 [Neodiprion virginianus]